MFEKNEPVVEETVNAVTEEKHVKQKKRKKTQINQVGKSKKSKIKNF